MRLSTIIRELPIPAILSGGLAVGLTGELPVVGNQVDTWLSEIDVYLWTSTRQPTLFIFFCGLTVAWGLHLVVRVSIFWRKQNALVRLSELRERGAHLRNDCAEPNRPPSNDLDEMKLIESAIYRYAGMVSKSEAGRLRTIDTFDSTKHPPFVQDIPVWLYFSERIRRLDEFISKHSKAE